MLQTKLVENPKRANMFSTVVEEDGKRIWDKKNGEIRKAILEIIPEYKQLNLLAECIAEIVNADSDLQDNAVIANAMAKFAEINKLRGK